MSSQHKNESSPQMVLDALETLATIVDLGSDQEDYQNRPEIEIEGEIFFPSFHLIDQKPVNEITLEKIREVFQTILIYLKSCCRHRVKHLMDARTIEGIKAIMSLVGDAAKKLDQHLNILQGEKIQAVSDLDEYKELQEFYSKKIEQVVDDRSLSRWIMGLARSTWLHEAEKRLESRYVGSSKQIFVDLETVRKDTEYELFLIRKEDGSRFFSPRLLRNMKLVCDFGGHPSQEDMIVSMEDLAFWQDSCAFKAAALIMHSIEKHLDTYYHEVVSHKEKELTVVFNKMIMALILASNSKHLLINEPLKSCCEYFNDFQQFFRETLRSRVFQDLMLSPPNSEDKYSSCLVDIVKTISRTMFLELGGMQEMMTHVNKLLVEAHAQSSTDVSDNKSDKSLWSNMAYDYAAMLKLFKKHSVGPLNNLLNLIESSNQKEFDPLLQGNLPNIWFKLKIPERTIIHFRSASPTHQGVINKAEVSSEFEAFLLANKIEGADKHLIVNLQDRTSWRENARCHAVENLMQSKSVGKQIDVETLAIDTEFYHQMRKYEKLNHAEPFIKQFQEQLEGDLSGFMFSPLIEKNISAGFIKKLLREVQEVFFEDKNTLTKQNRLDFITIVYMFMELKFIDSANAGSFSFSCKDGVDQGSAATALLFSFLTLLNRNEFSNKETNYLNLILYGPSLLVRERIMLPDIFNRVMSAIKQIEMTKHELGNEEFKKTILEKFGRIFHLPLLEATIEYPKEEP